MKKADKRENEDGALSSREIEVGASALIGVGVVVVIQLLGLSNLDWQLKIALHCFAVSIPLLSLVILNSIAASHYGLTLNAWYNSAALIAGVFASTLGFGMIFSHFSSVAGGVFYFLQLFGTYAWLRYKTILSANAASFHDPD